MRIFFDIVGAIGLLILILGAVCWFTPEDNTDNVAMSHFLALPFFGLGGLLFLIALIARVI